MKRDVLLVLLLTACSESRVLEGPDAVAPDAVTVSDTPSVDAGSARDVPLSPADVVAAQDVRSQQDAGTALPGRVVINEIRGSGEDWIELYNAGGTPVNLAGYGITDSDPMDGVTPRIADAVRFPAGTSLSPGDYLLVVADLAMPGMGPQTRCLMSGGPMRCFHAGFGISASRGEVVHLIDARDVMVDRAAYPMDGDAGLPSGQTLARLPNGVGGFTRGAPTPGMPNRTP